ncbi:MAG: carboxypeptidase regulatory-like domain-containing protein [Holophagales bacterium]|nr:carboxypeptidase regulatory-like domain-containing protein [Holophagales bacterium]
MNGTRSWGIATAALVLLLVASAGNLLAQSSTGSITGTVTDSAGGPVPGTSVRARNLGTGLTRATLSGQGGAFTFPLLPVGRYEVGAELPGFSPAKVSEVTVSVGGKVDLTLRVAIATTSAVLVTSETPLVETTRTQSSSVVNERAIANLPTNGRNFIDFVLTTPGVSKDRASATSASRASAGR